MLGKRCHPYPPRSTADAVDKLGDVALGALRVTPDGLLYRASQAALRLRACRDGDTRPVGRGGAGYFNATDKSYVEMGPQTTSTGRRLNYIFSPENRVQVNPTTAYPWRTIGQLNMQASNGNTYTCSGATVGRRAVLTAGHCVHSGPGGPGWYNVQFSAGRNGASNPYGTLSWSHITTYTAWTNSRDWRCVGSSDPAAHSANAMLGRRAARMHTPHLAADHVRAAICRVSPAQGRIASKRRLRRLACLVLHCRRDMAVIRFATNIGSTVGYMGLTTNVQTGYLNTAGCAACWRVEVTGLGAQMIIAAALSPSGYVRAASAQGRPASSALGRHGCRRYPGDKSSGTQWFNSRSETDLWIHNKLMYVKLDIIPGQSGSPTWELRNNGGRYIKGVVSHQSCPSGSITGTYPGQTCTSTVLGYNGIVQLDSEHFNNILAWR
jgi:V8-like Glu-specific endopeptidase